MNLSGPAHKRFPFLTSFYPSLLITSFPSQDFLLDTHCFSYPKSLLRYWLSSILLLNSPHFNQSLSPHSVLHSIRDHGGSDHEQQSNGGYRRSLAYLSPATRQRNDERPLNSPSASGHYRQAWYQLPLCSPRVSLTFTLSAPLRSHIARNYIHAPTTVNIDAHGVCRIHAKNDPRGRHCVSDKDTKVSKPLAGNKGKIAKLPRPANSFILYRQHHHPHLKAEHPEMHSNEICKSFTSEECS